MTSWLARDVYSPLLVVGAGLLTYAGVLGVGRLLLRAARIALPTPWDVVVQLLLGVQVMSLGVQLLGMASVASRGALLAWLLVFAIAAVAELARALHARRSAASLGAFPVALSLLVVSLAVNLVVAAAPSTKADEVYYHMLVPGRLIQDRALEAYLYPWESAWLPQTAFQIASAPLHAALVPDAPNVLSWALSLTMAWFLYRLLRIAGRSAAWCALWSTAAIAGMYSAVWYVTAGAHAMGELSIVALMIAALVPDTLRGVPDRTRALALGILASGASMTKLSTVPLAAVLLLAGVAPLCRGRGLRQAMTNGLSALAPVVVLWGPLLAWSWHRTGAPFGPFFSWWFPGSMYEAVPMRGLLASSARNSKHNLTAFELFTRHSPLLFLGALGALVTPALRGARRAFALSVFIAQAILIATLLPWDPRFLGGLPIALAAVFALSPPEWILRWATRRTSQVVLFMVVAPWALAPIYYARPFGRVVFGLESAERFREEYVAFYSDYRVLDRLLPPDAVLLMRFRTGATYAPRPAVWFAADVHGERPLYQFASDCASIDASLTAAETVYFNPAARAFPLRTPGRAAGRFPLCVRRLVPSRAGAKLSQ